MANTPSAGVRWCSSTTIRPSGWVGMPAAGRSSRSPLGRRPVATSSRSPRTTAPSARSSTTSRSAVAADPHGFGAQVHVPPVAGQRREPLGDGLVLAAQHRAAAPDDRHRAAEGREDVRELRGDVARPEDDQALGQRVDAHHGVGGVEGHARLRDDRRDGGPAAGGDHDPVGRERHVRPLDVQLAGTGEPGVPLVERDVAAPLGAVVPPGRGDRVDPAEHAVADVGPAHLVDGRVDPQVPGPAHGAGEVGGVHEHLGGDAADVEAGAAERRRARREPRPGARTARRGTSCPSRSR